MSQSPKPDARSESVPYAKMNGIGNQILVLDLRGRRPLSGDLARDIGAREGLDFDQLMAIGDARHPGSDAFVDIFNTDGSRAGACGNGTRCVAWFLLRNTECLTTTVETEAGLLRCSRDAEWIFTVDMGEPRFGWRDIPLQDAIENTDAVELEPTSGWIEALGHPSCLSMGNPHAVFWVGPNGIRPDLRIAGPALEHHPMFPERANISFAQVESRDRIRLDVWERGAGVTRACGSAACATLVAAVRKGLADRRADIILPGGGLTLEWRQADGHVLMTGPVEFEHGGDMPVDRPVPAH